MKFRVWAQIYPWQMDNLAQFKPFVSTVPIAPVEGGRVLAFDVEVPDDLFGTTMVAAIPVENGGDKL